MEKTKKLFTGFVWLNDPGLLLPENNPEAIEVAFYVMDTEDPCQILREKYGSDIKISISNYEDSMMVR